jgi:hypothetical protein
MSLAAVGRTRQTEHTSGSGDTCGGGMSMFGQDPGDFFSRWKRFLVEAAIFILFSISLLDFVWTKLSPYA